MIVNGPLEPTWLEWMTSVPTRSSLALFSCAFVVVDDVFFPSPSSPSSSSSPSPSFWTVFVCEATLTKTMVRRHDYRRWRRLPNRYPAPKRKREDGWLDNEVGPITVIMSDAQLNSNRGTPRAVARQRRWPIARRENRRRKISTTTWRKKRRRKKAAPVFRSVVKHCRRRRETSHFYLSLSRFLKLYKTLTRFYSDSSRFANGQPSSLQNIGSARLFRLENQQKTQRLSFKTCTYCVQFSNVIGESVLELIWKKKLSCLEQLVRMKEKTKIYWAFWRNSWSHSTDYFPVWILYFDWVIDQLEFSGESFQVSKLNRFTFSLIDFRRLCNKEREESCWKI